MQFISAHCGTLSLAQIPSDRLLECLLPRLTSDIRRKSPYFYLPFNTQEGFVQRYCYLTVGKLSFLLILPDQDTTLFSFPIVVNFLNALICSV